MKFKNLFVHIRNLEYVLKFVKRNNLTQVLGKPERSTKMKAESLTARQQQLLALIRTALGFLFLYSGLTKLLGDFTAAGYLNFATKGPLTDLFQALSGNPIVDFLVVYGEIAIGLSLILGVFVWLGALSGSLMMMLYYLSSFPPEHGLVSEHIIYILVFALLWAFDSGHYYGFQNTFDNILSKKRK